MGTPSYHLGGFSLPFDVLRKRVGSVLKISYRTSTGLVRKMQVLQLIESKEEAPGRTLWQLPAHHGNGTQCIETTWHGPHPARRFTRIVPLIGPFQDLRQPLQAGALTLASRRFCAYRYSTVEAHSTMASPFLVSPWVGLPISDCMVSAPGCGPLRQATIDGLCERGARQSAGG